MAGCVVQAVAAAGGWLARAGCRLMRLMRRMTLAVAGWLAGWQPNQKSVEENLRSIAGLKVHQKNIQKTRRQAGGCKSKMCI